MASYFSSVKPRLSDISFDGAYVSVIVYPHECSKKMTMPYEKKLAKSRRTNYFMENFLGFFMQDFVNAAGDGGFSSDDLNALLKLCSPVDAGILMSLRDDCDFSFPEDVIEVVDDQRDAKNARVQVRADAILGLQIISEDCDYKKFGDAPNCIYALATKVSEPADFDREALRIINDLESHYRGLVYSDVERLTQDFIDQGATYKGLSVVDSEKSYSVDELTGEQAEMVRKYYYADFYYNNLSAIRQTLHLPEALAPLPKLPDPVRVRFSEAFDPVKFTLEH